MVADHEGRQHSGGVINPVTDPNSRWSQIPIVAPAYISFPELACMLNGISIPTEGASIEAAEGGLRGRASILLAVAGNERPVSALFAACRGLLNPPINRSNTKRSVLWYGPDSSRTPDCRMASTRRTTSTICISR
jgi:hypothetical protein